MVYVPLIVLLQGSSPPLEVVAMFLVDLLKAALNCKQVHQGRVEPARKVIINSGI